MRAAPVILGAGCGSEAETGLSEEVISILFAVCCWTFEVQSKWLAPEMSRRRIPTTVLELLMGDILSCWGWI